MSPKKQIPLWNILSQVGSCIFLLGLLSCSGSSESTLSSHTGDTGDAKAEIELSTAQFESAGMKLGRAERIAFYDEVRATGHIDVPPSNRVAVSTYFGGYVKDIDLLNGQKVTKGRVLFTLEDPQYIQMQQDLLEAKGRLSYLRSDMERQKNLLADRATSEKNFLKAESEFTVTQVQYEALRSKLRMIHIDPETLTVASIRSSIPVYAPISGYVSTLHVTKGAHLAPSDVALSIVDTDHMHLELNVFEADLPRIREDQEIRFHIRQDNSREYKASVHLINKTIDEESRTIRIHGHPNMSDVNLLSPGMYVEARILTKADTALAIPSDAVVEANGVYYALMLTQQTGDKYIFQKVEIPEGRTDGTFRELRNAASLPRDAQFLVSGAFQLINE